MKKLVLQLDYYDDKVKQKAMQKVSGLPGIELIAIDSKEKKLTVVGDVDPVNLVYKLRKLCRTDIVSIGPAKEPEKKKEEPKKDDPNKGGDEKKPGGGGGGGTEKKPGGGGDAKKPGGGGSGDFKKIVESRGDAVKAYPALPPPPAYQQQLQPFQYHHPQFPQYPPPLQPAHHQFPYQHYPPPPAPVYYTRGAEEDPNSCAIC